PGVRQDRERVVGIRGPAAVERHLGAGDRRAREALIGARVWDGGRLGKGSRRIGEGEHEEQARRRAESSSHGVLPTGCLPTSALQNPMGVMPLTHPTTSPGGLVIKLTPGGTALASDRPMLRYGADAPF